LEALEDRRTAASLAPAIDELDASGKLPLKITYRRTGPVGAPIVRNPHVKIRSQREQVSHERTHVFALVVSRYDDQDTMQQGKALRQKADSNSGATKVADRASDLLRLRILHLWVERQRQDFSCGLFRDRKSKAWRHNVREGRLVMQGDRIVNKGRDPPVLQEGGKSVPP